MGPWWGLPPAWVKTAIRFNVESKEPMSTVASMVEQKKNSYRISKQKRSNFETGYQSQLIKKEWFKNCVNNYNKYLCNVRGLGLENKQVLMLLFQDILERIYLREYFPQKSRKKDWSKYIKIRNQYLQESTAKTLLHIITIVNGKALSKILGPSEKYIANSLLLEVVSICLTNRHIYKKNCMAERTLEEVAKHCKYYSKKDEESVKCFFSLKKVTNKEKVNIFNSFFFIRERVDLSIYLACMKELANITEVQHGATQFCYKNSINTKKLLLFSTNIYYWDINDKRSITRYGKRINEDGLEKLILWIARPTIPKYQEFDEPELKKSDENVKLVLKEYAPVVTKSTQCILVTHPLGTPKEYKGIKFHKTCKGWNNVKKSRKMFLIFDTLDASLIFYAIKHGLNFIVLMDKKNTSQNNITVYGYKFKQALMKRGNLISSREMLSEKLKAFMVE